MDVVNGPRLRQAYYFSWVDHEILDDRTLTLSSDEDTWLYKCETGSSRTSLVGSSFPDQQTPTNSGIVDSRTFSRRKRCSLRPSLESVVESPLSNCSSLGLLDPSKLLNASFLTKFTPTTTKAYQERFSSNSTGSDMKFAPRRFKLDSPFMNSESLGVSKFSTKEIKNFAFDRTRLDSESSDLSFPYTLGNCSPFENGCMTDSVVKFLENIENHPINAFENRDCMNDSLVSLPEAQNELDNNELMTESMVYFLEPVNCKPPSGFEDNEMIDSVISIDENVLPASEMTTSVMDYLKNMKSSESENIPPEYCDPTPPPILGHTNCTDRLMALSSSKKEEETKLNSTYDLEKIKEISSDMICEKDDLMKITLSNCARIDRRYDNGGFEEKHNTQKINSIYESELDLCVVKDNADRNIQTRALNNKDLNITNGLISDEQKDLNTTKTLVKDLTQNKLNSTISINNTRNCTFTKSEIDEALNAGKQIPSRNTTFNTTFTKLVNQEPLRDSTFIKNETKEAEVVKSTEELNGRPEDDQTSSASDSSFSSGSTRPRSVDEVRTIARHQESLLGRQTSTPTESKAPPSSLEAQFQQVSPVRVSHEYRGHIETRSANTSPVRNPLPRPSYPHPISRLQQPIVEARRQTLQASSMSNIARPKASGLRMPQPVSRFTAPQRSGSRPATAPTVSMPAIPRPNSRLPMPRFRGSGIPGLKRGGAH